MPTLTRWFLKAGLLYFLGALLLAVLLSLERAVPGLYFVENGWPVFYHFFFVGWITQIIFGVSYWMFPPLNRESPRGNLRYGWAAFVLLNGGLLLRAFSEPFIRSNPNPIFQWMLVASGIFQFLAGLSYVALIWRRVKPGPVKRAARDA